MFIRIVEFFNTFRGIGRGKGKGKGKGKEKYKLRD